MADVFINIFWNDFGSFHLRRAQGIQVCHSMKEGERISYLFRYMLSRGIYI